MQSNLTDFDSYLYTYSTQGQYGSGSYNVTGEIPLDNIDITKSQVYSIAWHGDRKREVTNNNYSLKYFILVFSYKKHIERITLYTGINKIYYQTSSSGLNYGLVSSPDLAQWNRLTAIFAPLNDKYLFSFSTYVNGEKIIYFEKDYENDTYSWRNEYYIYTGYPYNSGLGMVEFCIGELEFLNTSADLTGTKYMRAPQ